MEDAKMKKRKNGISAINAAAVLLAVLTAVFSRTFLGPCVHDDGSFGACHWAGQALFGTALLTAVQSLAGLLARTEGMKKGLFLAAALTSVLGILIPGTLIDLCGMASMRCRALMRPSMTILFVLLLILSAAGFMLTGRKGDQE